MYSEHADLVATNVWPVLLLAPDGQILAASEPARDLLGDEQLDAGGRTLESYLVTADRPGLRRLLAELAQGGEPLFTQAHLQRPGQGPRRIEIELRPVQGLEAPHVTALLYPDALGNRRADLIIGCNRLAPQLLRAQSPQAVYEMVAKAIRVFGFGMQVLELDASQTSLRYVFDSSGAAFLEQLRQAAGYSPRDMAIPTTAPLLRDVIAKRRALFDRDALSLTAALYPPAAVELIRTTQELIGLYGYIYAPMVVDDRLHGIIVVWGERLSPDDIPFIEAFAIQIASALAQIELRRAMEQQIQRLNSLATTARAVTTLGELEDVLQIICVQATQLLGGESSTLVLPTEDGKELVVRTAVGGNPVRLGRAHPIDGSLFGIVFTSGVGFRISDIHADPRTYPVALVDNPIRSVIYQPLIHQGKVLGVLNVGHSEVDYFTQEDLDFLRRYAEYAAMAIANARLYREVEASRRYLDAIIQNVPGGMLVIRPDQTIRPLNLTPLQLAGYDASNLDGKTFLDYCPEERHDELLARWEAVLAGEPQRFEMEVRRADGQLITTQISADLIPEYGEVLVMVRDITKRRRFEAHMRQSEKLAALGRLVAGAAHELNNPLAIILGLTQLQLLENLPQHTREDLQNIERAALRASAIIQQLRLFSNPQQLRSQLVDLAATARDALMRLSAQIASQRITTMRIFENEPLQIEGEPVQIEQALFNILQNAVQALATNPPEAPRRLAIRAWRNNGTISLRISDTGPGISPEHLPKIFDPFFTTRDVGQGTGLGLTIAHTIIEQHGGHLWATNDPDTGAVFEMELPAAPAQNKAPVAVRLPSGLRVLIIEDEELVSAVASRALTRLGCSVDAVATLEEGLARARSEVYDLIVCDLQLPGMDRTDLFTELADGHTRFLMLSGDPPSEDGRSLVASTRLPVLTKPFTQEQLLRMVVESLAS